MSATVRALLRAWPAADDGPAPAWDPLSLVCPERARRGGRGLRAARFSRRTLAALAGLGYAEREGRPWRTWTLTDDGVEAWRCVRR